MSTTSRLNKDRKKNGRTRRACSVCGSMGHNSRTCTSKSSKFQVPSFKSSFITVHVRDEVKASPHVVDFKKNKKQDVWSGMPVYAEEVNPRSSKRQIVDFAQMVRQANAMKIPEHESVKTHPDEKILVRQQSNIFAEHKKIKKEKISHLPRFGFSFVSNVLHQIGEGVSDVWHAFTRACKERELKIMNGVVGLPRRFAVSIRYNFTQTISVVTVLTVLIGLPFPTISYYQKVKADTAKIVEESTNAFLSLQSSTVAALNTNLAQAEHDLNAALVSFGAAENLIDKEHRALVYVASMLPVVGKKIESRQELLVAGHHLALGNTYLVKGADEITKNTELQMPERFAILKNHVRSALPQYTEALEALGRVDRGALPAEYQESFEDFKVLFASFINDMGDLVDVMDGLETMFGTREMRRYLVIFQNNHEIRPTGGFMGSYATFDVQKFAVSNIIVPPGGTYDVRAGLDTYLKPPLPLQIINKRWEFQDANWFPDFKTSAQKSAWFYQESQGSSVDGVIAINASVLERLLVVLGPLAVEDRNLVLDSQRGITQLQSEIEEDKVIDSTRPKEVLAEVLQNMMGSISSIRPEQTLALLTQLHDALRQKEIQVYFTDEREQDIFSDFGWTGEIMPHAQGQDYLMVVNANIGGAKTDAVVKQEIEHQAVIDAEGYVVDTTIIRRWHDGQTSQNLYGRPNINYIRVYVPEGAELLEARGFVYPPEDMFQVPEDYYTEDVDLAKVEQEASTHVESGTRISHEFGKTVFGNWIVTNPGEETEVYFTYRLPIPVFVASDESDSSPHTYVDRVLKTVGYTTKESVSRYSIAVQKQSGVASSFSSTVIYPEGWHPVWKTDDEVQVSANGAVIQGDLSTDKVFGVVMKYFP